MAAMSLSDVQNNIASTNMIKDDAVTVVAMSGQTSPEENNTIFTGHRRSPSLETVLTEITQRTSTISSDDGTGYPDAPMNSPEQSLAGDTLQGSSPSLDTDGLVGRLNTVDASVLAHASTLGTMSLAERLHSTPGVLLPAVLVKDEDQNSDPGADQGEDQGKTQRKEHNKARIRTQPIGNYPLSQLLFKKPRALSPAVPRKGRRASSASVDGSHQKAHSRLDCMEVAYDVPETNATLEHSMWAELAEEDVIRALSRMARVAKDEHMKNGGQRPVSEYYSRRLAELIKAAEIEFDLKFLR